VRKVLFVTPAFPPQNHIAARRPAGLAKYMKEFGWDVTVLTQCEPQHVQNPLSPAEMREQTGLDESRIIRVARPVRRLSRNPILKALSGVAEYWVLPGSDNRRVAKLSIEKTRGMDLDADVIWATAPGYSVFIVASNLAKRLGVPWVADFRDIADKYVVYPRWVRGIMAWREAVLCKGASHVITVERNEEILARRHRLPVTFIPNGFEPEHLCETPRRPSPDVFRIVYTGSVRGEEDLLPVFQAANALVAEGAIPRKDVHIEFYGFLGRQARRAHQLGLTSDGVRCMVKPWQSWPDTLRAQREATVLLVLGSSAMPYFIPGKLFEYMAAGRPVLAYPQGPTGIDRILRSTGIGRSCSSVGELRELIREWYLEWKRTGDIHLDRNPAEIGKWSRREQAGQLAAVLESVVAGSGARRGAAHA